jgi:hypothetical protein
VFALYPSPSLSEKEVVKKILLLEEIGVNSFEMQQALPAKTNFHKTIFGTLPLRSARSRRPAHSLGTRSIFCSTQNHAN